MTLVGCGSDASEPNDTATKPSSATSDPLATPTLGGRFRVDHKGRQLAVRCWGEGSPTIVLDAGTGDGGIAAFEYSDLARELAYRTRVCTYDRAGLGYSDAAPARRRGLGDAADDLHALLSAADMQGPYVLVGSSGGDPEGVAAQAVKVIERVRSG